MEMGVTVISYTIKSITDQVGYLASLGMAQSAHVKSNALIGQVTIWGFNKVNRPSSIADKGPCVLLVFM